MLKLQGLVSESRSELPESKLSESRSGSGKVSCISAIDGMGSHAISQRSKLVDETFHTISAALLYNVASNFTYIPLLLTLEI